MVIVNFKSDAGSSTRAIGIPVIRRTRLDQRDRGKQQARARATLARLGAAMFALAVLVFCRPVAGQTLGLYAGGMEMRDAGRDSSYAWALEHLEQLTPHFDLGLLYLNEGHPRIHHRDGFGAQAWIRASPMGGRLTLAAGVGPYYYFDTTSQGRGIHENHHGLGLIYGLAAALRVGDRWSLQLRLNRVDTRRQFDTNVWLLGAGYELDGRLARSYPAASDATVLAGNVAVLAGQSIVNSFESERGTAVGIEYRRALSRPLEWTLGFLHEGDGQRVHRTGIAAQGWVTQSTRDDRISVGVGVGPYLAIDRRNAATQDSRRLAAMVSLSARYRFAPRWHARATWNRVATRNDSDTDVLLVGVGYSF